MRFTENIAAALASSGPSRFQSAILGGLQAKHVYAGTVPAAVVARRRKANKAARIARRNNR